MPADHDFSADVPGRSRLPGQLTPQTANAAGSSVASLQLPRLVRLASQTWKVIGLVVMTNAAIHLALKRGGCCFTFLEFSLGFTLLFFGMLGLLAGVTDTLSLGIGSIVIGLLHCVLGLWVLLTGLARHGAPITLFAPGAPLVPQAWSLVDAITWGVVVICGIGLVLAGTLALRGRSAYLAYRRTIQQIRAVAEQQPGSGKKRNPAASSPGGADAR